MLQAFRPPVNNFEANLAEEFIATPIRINEIHHTYLQLIQQKVHFLSILLDYRVVHHLNMAMSIE